MRMLALKNLVEEPTLDLKKNRRGWVVMTRPTSASVTQRYGSLVLRIHAVKTEHPYWGLSAHLGAAARCVDGLLINK